MVFRICGWASDVFLRDTLAAQDLSVAYNQPQRIGLLILRFSRSRFLLVLQSLILLLFRF